MNNSPLRLQDISVNVQDDKKITEKSNEDGSNSE